jgi:quinol monooxygenase YgiN
MLLSFIDIDMAELIEMDKRVGIFEQMEENVGPVILINKFSVNPDEFEQFIKGWATEAEKFKEQPGFISTQLHKGIGKSGTFVNYAVWESAAQFKEAVRKVMDPQDRLSAYPPSTIASPHLFKKVAVPGICVD